MTPPQYAAMLLRDAKLAQNTSDDDGIGLQPEKEKRPNNDDGDDEQLRVGYEVNQGKKKAEEAPIVIQEEEEELQNLAFQVRTN